MSIPNTTFAPLGSSQSWTGEWQNIEGFASAVVSVITDKAGTAFMDFSADGINLDSTFSFTVSAGVSESHKLSVTRKFFRARFANSTSAQTYLRLQSIFGQQQQLTSPLNATVQQDADSTIVRTIDTELTISSGSLEGYSLLNKGGYNPDVDQLTCPEDLWAAGALYTGFPSGAETVQVFSSSALDTALGTGARTVTLLGLDANYNSITETIALNGVTPVLSTQAYLRTIGISVLTSGSAVYNQGTLTCRQSVTQSNVFAFALPGHNQSQTACYTVPAGKTAYIRRISGSCSGAANSSATCAVWVRNFGQVPRFRKMFQINSYSSLQEIIYGGMKITEKSDIAYRIISVTNNNVEVTGGFDIILIDN